MPRLRRCTQKGQSTYRRGGPGVREAPLSPLSKYSSSPACSIHRGSSSFRRPESRMLIPARCLLHGVHLETLSALSVQKGAQQMQAPHPILARPQPTCTQPGYASGPEQRRLPRLSRCRALHCLAASQRRRLPASIRRSRRLPSSPSATRRVPCKRRALGRDLQRDHESARQQG